MLVNGMSGLISQRGVVTATIAHGEDVIYPVRAYQRLVRRTFGKLDLVLAVSRATGSECLGRGLASGKLRIVPNGIDRARFAKSHPKDGPPTQPENLSGASLPAQPDFLLCSVCRLVPRKGIVWFLCNVMPQLPEAIHYWIIGAGPEFKGARAAIRHHGLRDRVQLLGRLSDTDLAQLYRRADVLVMPNVPQKGTMEGFGLVALEAGSCGLPAVASRLEGIAEVIRHRHTGILVPPLDGGGFAAAILECYGSRGWLKSLGCRARQETAKGCVRFRVQQILDCLKSARDNHDLSRKTLCVP